MINYEKLHKLHKDALLTDNTVQPVNYSLVLINNRSVRRTVRNQDVFV